MRSLVVLACLAANAHAYVRTTADGKPLHWASHCPRLQAPLAVDDPLGAAVVRAIDAWGLAVCSALPFAVTDGEATSVEHDGVSAVLWRTAACTADDFSPLCSVPNAAAVTTIFFRDSGEIIEADIEVAASVFASDAPGGALDLDGVITHELGHALGLDHSCGTIPGLTRDDHLGRPSPMCSDPRAQSPEIRWATMYPMSAPGETFKRDPIVEETQGLCAIYGAHDGTCASGGCSTGKPGLAVGILAASLLRRRRSSAAGTSRGK